MSDAAQPREYTDPETLERLYWDEGMTLREIGAKFGVSFGTVRYYMNKHGINTRDGGNEYDHVPLYYKSSGEYIWQHEYDHERAQIGVHRLVAIADGADPYDVFADAGKVVKHTNGINWDNRPENIEVASYGSWNKYTDKELLEWIEVFVREFGVAPTGNDISGWPGPSAYCYRQRFGTFTKAVEAAGYEPRGGADE